MVLSPKSMRMLPVSVSSTGVILNSPGTDHRALQLRYSRSLYQLSKLRRLATSINLEIRSTFPPPDKLENKANRLNISSIIGKVSLHLPVRRHTK